MMDDYADPYDAMPFGDAMRFEDEQVARDMDAGEGTPDDIDLDPCPDCGALGLIYPCSECGYNPDGQPEPEPFDAADYSAAVMLYFDHQMGAEGHVGGHYTFGCPTCDDTYFTPAELDIIYAITEFVTDKVAQTKGRVGA